MQIVDNVIIILLFVLSFLAGKKISDSYHRDTIEELRYQLRLHYAQKGVGYVAPPKKHVPIGQEFIDRLKENGHATQALRTPQN